MTPPITPVVGIGASAGGLEAFKLLLAHLPADPGVPVVLVQHLDPRHHSILSEILGRTTHMPVAEAADHMAVEPNHVHVIPPNAEIAIAGRALRLTPREQTPGPHMPIDRFLRSLAEECGSRAVGVILSGAGTDGAAGLEESPGTPTWRSCRHRSRKISSAPCLPFCASPPVTNSAAIRSGDSMKSTHVDASAALRMLENSAVAAA